MTPQAASPSTMNQLAYFSWDISEIRFDIHSTKRMMTKATSDDDADDEDNDVCQRRQWQNHLNKSMEKLCRKRQQNIAWKMS